ncbi:MAG: IPT/TIG domain-containing protein [Bacteroidetes bacterium]|nr:IPT/TIG domain-containing protein [Bacteroidota bacterium]
MKFRLLPFFLVAAMFVFSACSDDDDGTPVAPSNKISVTNLSPISGPIGTTVTIKGTNFGTDPAELTITFGGVTVTPTSVKDTEIKVMVPGSLAIGATSIKLKRGTGSEVTVQFTVEDPIVGTWTSEGANVAPLLYGAPFNVRKIVATFKSDGSYLVVQTDSSGTSLNLTGVYVAAAGNAPAPNDMIRTVTVNQGAPTSVTAEGIYEVTVGANSITMKYEIAQTEPPLAGVTKPTPALGFGSTAGGAFGMINIQNYVKN